MERRGLVAVSEWVKSSRSGLGQIEREGPKRVRSKGEGPWFGSAYI